MKFKDTSRRLSAVAFALLISACGGGSGGLDGDGSSSEIGGGATPPAGGDDNNDAPPTSSTYQMGSFTSGSFVPSVLDITIEQLSAHGATQVSATIVDQDGVPYADPVDVTFTSTCVQNNQATIESPITTSKGIAETTFTAINCNITDTITANAMVGGTKVSASGDITVRSAEAGSIQFVSAEPTLIALKGSGGVGRSETSVLTFRVVDAKNNAVAGVPVEFTFSLPGNDDLTLSDKVVETDAEGIASTVVSAGKTVTTIRVVATVRTDSKMISTQSDSLRVGAGLPDDDSFSLSADIYNPEAWSYDGETVAITARLGDSFNHRVPDGTSVAFWTNYGTIGDGNDHDCLTQSGACSVSWISQGERPHDGLVTVIAFTVGEESFHDTIVNGLFDEGENLLRDIGEAFVDSNNNNSYDQGEEFIDFDGNGAYTSGDGLYNGTLCTTNHSGCSSEVKSVMLWKSVTLAMSGSEPIASPTEEDTAFSLDESTKTITVTLGDERDNVLPAGTTISASTDLGKLSSPSSYTVPSISSNDEGLTAGRYDFRITGESGLEEAKQGTLEITVKTPKASQARYFRYTLIQEP